MGSLGVVEKQKLHAVCIPYPAQGHINPMFKLANILHYRGFHITFVHTEYNYRRLVKSRGLDSVKGRPGFRFETIPDGLPPSDDIDATQDIPSLCISTSKTCLVPFRNLLSKLNDSSSSNIPPVTCIISDGVMNTNYLINGYLDTIIDWIPGLIKDIRLRDLPSFVRTTDPDDILLNFLKEEAERERANKAQVIILNTFDVLELDALDALSSMFPRIYTIGPLHLLHNQIMEDGLKSVGSNLWKERLDCLEWLDSKKPNSVVYVNFGSITVMTSQQLVEFAWGLANSNHTFLWVIRVDLVAGDSVLLPPEFVTDTEERGLIVSWCPQEQVLNHPSIGTFLLWLEFDNRKHLWWSAYDLLAILRRTTNQLSLCMY
uniref:7-deoxyloganetin glucosyltransferase-like n=1 Tax=Nelumbo nucifera TaxID=4432 RepID=A0A822XX47_NELNU|nr:TPA_asm: hypothetical protein HUJ06_023441 [Nelumbo nucifera]